MGDHADDTFDEDWGAWLPRHREYRPRCKFCGRLCTWDMHAGKWRLYEQGALHSCTRPSADDFQPAD